VPVEQVELRDNGAYLLQADGDGKFTVKTEIKLTAVSEKMSKSRGNVINPDKVVEEFGADSLRLFEMFMGPLEAVKPWSTRGVVGVRTFLDRVWRMIVDDRADDNQLLPSVTDAVPTPEQDRMLHRTIAAVTRDIEAMSFNTAIPRMMEFTNFFFKEAVRPKSVMRRFVQLLAPFAPHIAEELWEILGGQKTLAYEPWPTYDPALLLDESVEIPVQINGKLRGKLSVPVGLDQAATEAAARGDEKIAELLAGKTVVKAIVVTGRMVNFVVR
jgi:leucyl-tRNA synthetase